MTEPARPWQVAGLWSVAWTLGTLGLVLLAWRLLTPMFVERDPAIVPWLVAYAIGLAAAGHAGAARATQKLLPAIVGATCIYLPSLVLSVLEAGARSLPAVGAGFGLALVQLVPFLAGIALGGRRRAPS